MIYVICDCCIGYILYMVFIGTYFLRYIHELISFIHFMMNSFLSFIIGIIHILI